MRKDITITNCMIGGEIIDINVSKIAQQYNCCWRTADKLVHPERYIKKEKQQRIYHSKLDSFKELINSKLEKQNIPATGIYDLLRLKYDYDGGYGIVKKYVRSVKKNIVKELTIRFNTIMGYQSQVDWKEKVTLHNKEGHEFIINIFLMVLGYSRYKYIELTSDRTQLTLFNAMINAFKYFNGTTETILFDNMSTIVDHAKSDYSKVVINKKAYQFSKDANFEIHTCKAYTPKTKGKVETLAKIMNRLKAFDYEFKDWDELDNIVKTLCYELNYNEKSQATSEEPYKRFEKEKEHLIPVNISLLETYVNTLKTYKVSKESMILYKGNKYSVPTHYVGECLSVKESDEFINIYYNTSLITKYSKNKIKKFNYKKDDYLDILSQSVYNDKAFDEIENISLNNLKSLDDINIDKGD